MKEIDDLVIAEANNRCRQGFGPFSEAIRSGYIASFRAKLMQAEADRKWQEYVSELLRQHSG